MNVRTKLIIGFSVIVVLLWLIAFSTSLGYRNLHQQFLDVEEEIVSETLLITNIESLASETYRETLDYMLHGSEEAKVNTQDLLDLLIRMEDINQSPSYDIDPGLLTAVEQFHFAINNMIATKDNGASLEDLMVMDQTVGLPALLSLQQAATVQKIFNNEELAIAKADFNNTYTTGLRSILISVAIITLIALVAAVLTTRSIVKPLNRLRKGTEMIARGNLDYKVGTKAGDEIGQLSRAFDKMTDGLMSTMTSIDNLTSEINERKKVEKALQKSEEKFRVGFEHSFDAIFFADVGTGILLDVNQAGCELLGLPKEKIIGMHQSEMHPEGTVEKHKELFREHVEKGNALIEDMLVQRADGTQVPVDISTSLVELDGKPTMQGVFRDITKRKEGRAALLESEEKFSKAFHSSSNANIITTFKGGRVIDVNDSFLELTGYTRKEVVGKSIINLNIWADVKDREEMLRVLKKDGRAHNREYNFRTKSGEIRTWLFSAELIDVGNEPCIIAINIDISERKKAEEALRESEEFNSSLLENAPNPIGVINPDTSIRYANPAFGKLTGFTAAEIIGTKAPYPWWSEEKLQADMDIDELKQHIKDGFPVREEHNFQKKNGERFWVELNTTVVMDKGKPKYSVANWLDITERKRAEEALRKSEEKFSKAFRSSPNGVTITTIKEGRFIDVNDSFLELSGYTRGEVLGNTAHNLNTWADIKDREEMLRVLKKYGRVHNQEYNFRMKSGEVRTWLFAAELIDIGSEPCIISLNIDITERKRAEEALRANEERFRLLLDNSTALILRIQTTPDLRTDYVSPSCLRISGYTQEDFYNNPNLFFEIIHPEDRELSLKRMKSAQERDQKPIVVRLIRKDDRVVWVDQIQEAIAHEQGETVAMHLIIRDITERKQMEDELMVHREHLEELVRERTAELTDLNNRLEHELKERQKAEVALLAAKDEAETANQAKSEFLARTSHEIRTPIHGVMGMIDLVLDSKLEQDQRQYLKMAISSAESLLNIINDILDLSKIEAGQLEPEREGFNLRTTLEDTLDSMAVTADNKGLELTCHLLGGVTTDLIGDPGLLRQVLVNLIGNSIKFTEKGEVALYVEPISDSKKETELHFTVRDTGIGIPKSKFDVIFEPFQQADGSINRKYGGTGLGLTISRHLVDQMGGRIWVEKSPHKGSIFHFTGKFSKQANGKHSGNGSKSILDVQKVPLLLVDDNATNRLMVKDFLVNRGFDVTDVASGPAALKVIADAGAKSVRYRIIILDKTMDGMDGLAVAERMLDDSIKPSEIIMMLPPHSVSDDFSRCQKLGILNYIIKPVKESALQNALLTALGETPESKEKTGKITLKHESVPNLRILVAEDNPTSQLIARKTLEKMGHNVEIAQNGSEAVKMTEESDFDLILMDAEMPVLNGIEATRMIRKREHSSSRHIPIIAMTAYAMKEDKKKCLEAGMDGYLSKPAKPEEINAIISELLASNEKAVSASDSVSQTEPKVVPPVDIKAAMQVFGGDDDLLGEAVDLFLAEDYPVQVKSLREGIERRDAAAVKAAAHSVKGAARSLGGTALADVALRLEELSRQGKLEGAGEFADKLEYEVKRFADYYSQSSED